jgi:hypothetical protein
MLARMSGNPPGGLVGRGIAVMAMVENECERHGFLPCQQCRMPYFRRAFNESTPRGMAAFVMGQCIKKEKE